MYHSHAFVPWTFCLQTRVYCTESVKVSLKKLFVCVVNIISVRASSRALTISTLVLSVGVRGQFKGGERMGITIVLLSHSHCTIESYRLLIILSPHPPSCVFTGSASSPMLQRSCCQDEEGRRFSSSSVLTSELSAMMSQEPMCQGNSSATEEIIYLFIPNGRSCRVHCVTQQPLFSAVISALAPHLTDTSP